MPRKSTAALLLPPVDGASPRLKPPASLSAPEAQLFRDLIAAVDRKHFRSSDLPLLCRYVEAAVLAEEAARELREHGAVIDGRPSPWLVVQEKCVRTIGSLSLRLKLSPQSRLTNRDAGRRKCSFHGHGCHEGVGPMPHRPQTTGEKAADWIESWCATPAGKPVRLSAEDRATVYAIFDGGIAQDVTGPLASFLTLLALAGPSWARSENRPGANLRVDIFSLWGAASAPLRRYLHRQGEVIVCPELGTRWSRAA